MKNLINWWKDQKKINMHPLITITIFHQRFEYIHPFTDRNGRVGRLIFIWMLIKYSYGVILFKKSNRQTYFTALNYADDNRPKKLLWHCVRAYKKTLKELLKSS